MGVTGDVLDASECVLHLWLLDDVKVNGTKEFWDQRGILRIVNFWCFYKVIPKQKHQWYLNNEKQHDPEKVDFIPVISEFDLEFPYNLLIFIQSTQFLSRYLLKHLALGFSFSFDLINDLLVKLWAWG